MRFPVSIDVIKKEVSVKAFYHVADVCEWLYGIPLFNGSEFRVAPSFMTRCEAEMLGLSSPRFVYRVCLPNGSFVGLRRLAKLADRIGQQYSHQETIDAIRDKLLGEKSAIADSLLQVPERYPAERYYLMKTNLGRYLGEDKAKSGVPYLQYMELGGGLCAQAACLLAMMFNHRHARKICGIPEVTYLASAHQHGSNTAQSEILMSGLNEQTVVSALNSAAIGLSASREIELLDNRNRRIKPGAKDWKLEKVALNSYLLSDVPVIYPVDHHKLMNCDPGSILHDNNRADMLFRPELQEQAEEAKQRGNQPIDDESDPHMVVLGGCRSDGEEFVLHDPATAPFLKCHWNELLSIRRQGNSDREDFFRFISVASEDVLVRLLPQVVLTKPEGKSVTKPGLIQVAKQLQTQYREHVCGAPVLYQTPDQYRSGTFALFKWDDKASRRVLKRFLMHNFREDKRKVPAAKWRKLFRIIVQTLHRPSKAAKDKRPADPRMGHQNWIWAQCAWDDRHPDGPQRAIWLWDAQSGHIRPKISKLDIGQLVAAIIPESAVTADNPLEQVLFNEEMLWAKPKAEGTKPTELHFRRSDTEASPARLVPSIISSFTTLGAGASCHVQSWKLGSPKACELYLMMEPEAGYWHKKLSPTCCQAAVNQFDAIELLAGLNQQGCDVIAKSLAQQFAEKNIEIVAVATFLPEVSDARDKRFVPAMRNVGRIVQKLRTDPAHPHKVRCVELVGGSRITDLKVTKSRVSGKRVTEYKIGLVTAEQARTNLLTNLRAVLQPDATTGFQWPEEVQMSVELEPGTFFLIRDWESLKAVGEELDKCPLLSSMVGINLDVAHWRMAGIRPVMKGDSEPLGGQAVNEVLRRVNHVHVSGHHKAAHFGDVRPMLAFNLDARIDDVKSEYAQWLHFYHYCQSLDECLPGSGYASLELEAASDVEYVRRAEQEFRSILANY